jgi:toxin ParE1/3/4
VRLVWSRHAEYDADAIEEYIALDKPATAIEVRDEIELQIKRLKDFPEMGRKGRVRGTRELVIAGLPYVVVYRLKGKIIEIVRVLHGAQQWPQRQ